ncbi:transposable element Tcb1 transposase [Trichonephila clavipes]|nr:transposable element Tcb1 transposase [Trichonephila clavipes]
MGAEFLFMDDNARLHRANIVNECLQSEDITRMDWPAYSADLNPIEHVWDKLGRRIAAHQPPPICLPELRRALLDEWCNIPQDQIVSLILSMPRRYMALLHMCSEWMVRYCEKQMQVAFPPRKPKAVASIPDGVNRFSGCENHRHTSYKYVAGKRSLEYQFGYGALDKIKSQ